jgi:hypothetical protein
LRVLRKRQHVDAYLALAALTCFDVVYRWRAVTYAPTLLLLLLHVYLLVIGADHHL